MGNRFWWPQLELARALFDAGLRRAQSGRATVAQDASVVRYRESGCDGFRQVVDNLAALRILAEQETAQEPPAQACRRTDELTPSQHKSGTVSYLNVAAARAAQLPNELAAVGILRESASVWMIRALGGGSKAAHIAS